MADNRGAQRLRSLGKSQSELARELGVKDSSIVSRWFRGERKPDTVQRAAIEDSFAIGWRLWDEDVPEASSPGASADEKGAA